MALIVRKPDGTFATNCAICGKALSEPIFATSHFIGDPTHDLYRFSDAAMHWSCYVNWPEQARFASLYFEARLKGAQTGRSPQYWPILLKSVDVLVMYGVAVDEIAIVLRKSGTEVRIGCDEWQHFLAGNWREMCRAGLECEAVALAIPEVTGLTLPRSGIAPNDSPMKPSGGSGTPQERQG